MTASNTTGLVSSCAEVSRHWGFTHNYLLLSSPDLHARAPLVDQLRAGFFMRLLHL